MCLGGFVATIKNNCYPEHLWGGFLFGSFPPPTPLYIHPVLHFVVIFFSIPENTKLLLQVYLCFKVPASIAGDHDSNSEEVVLSHLLLGDDPDDGPLGGRG